MLRKSIILSCLICLLLPNLWPSVQGKIEGTVTDSNGNPLEKVLITITSLKASEGHINIKTDKKGKFVQVGLWPGRYQVSLKKSGYTPVSYEVRVRIAEATKLVVKMVKAEEAIERSLSQADRLFLKGYKLYEQGKYEEAASAYEEATKLSSTQWGYFFNLGLAYKKLNKTEEAMASFRKAVELNPDSFSSNKELGEVLGKGGNYEEARKHFQRAIEISSDEPGAFYNLGVCLMNLGESVEALSAFLNAVEIKEDYVEAYYQIGTIYIGQNRTEEAVMNLEKFLELAPEHEKAPIAKQLLDYLKK
ncbi:MAG: tetratricopeptide repeat protein [Candidatus Aminicenantes bacterium]|nr:tetratricopeptide repeat protein [Candidatus Aminicenantes bacterium]